MDRCSHPPAGSLVVSLRRSQHVVLHEFYVNVTRKIAVPISKPAAPEIVAAYAPWCVNTTSAETAAAFRLEDEARIGFWDALIVAAARKAGAVRILSEDLNGGQTIAGIRIENPFKGLASGPEE